MAQIPKYEQLFALKTRLKYLQFDRIRSFEPLNFLYYKRYACLKLNFAQTHEKFHR